MVKLHKNHGFSIIELVAVIAIITILAAAIIPKVGKYSKQALNTRNIMDAQNIVQAAELYNIDCEDETKKIKDITTIKELKSKLYNENDENKSYLNKWPELKYKDGNGKTIEFSTYKDILNFIKGEI
jgi:type IV pilus assembly protein PilA